MSSGTVRDLLGGLPRWARSPLVLTVPLLLIVVPVVVSLLRASHFDTRLEVFPATPPGNAGASSDERPVVRDVIANPGFQLSVRHWKGQVGFALRHTTRLAHSGTGAMAVTQTLRTPAGGIMATTPVVLPVTGRYRVQAWVRLPRDYRGGPPVVGLEGASAPRRVALHKGDARLRGRWQQVSTDYVVGAKRAKARIALAGAPAAQRGAVVRWDDVRVLSSSDAGLSARRANLVSNPDFENDMSEWGDPPSLTAKRSVGVAHSGNASRRTSSDLSPTDRNAGYTFISFPRAGVYEVEGWVYMPKTARASAPGLFLEGFNGITPLAQRLGDPLLRGAWQPVSAFYRIAAGDLQGSLVLRDLPDITHGPITARERRRRAVVYWDDLSVPIRRPDVSVDTTGAGAALRAALIEPQLRFEVALIATDKELYRPERATVTRSPRTNALSYLVTVRSDVPDDARRLSGPLRTALLRAAARTTLRRAQAALQDVVSKFGAKLSTAQRDRFQRRANVLQRLIGAQASGVVALPESTPVGKPSVKERKAEAKVQRDRQKVISRLGIDLPPRDRVLVQQRADDLQRMIGAHAADFIVVPAGSQAKPTRAVDRLLDRLPGSFPPRIDPLWAGAAGLICTLLLLGMLLAVTALRHPRSVPGP